MVQEARPAPPGESKATTDSTPRDPHAQASARARYAALIAEAMRFSADPRIASGPLRDSATDAVAKGRAAFQALSRLRETNAAHCPDELQTLLDRFDHSLQPIRDAWSLAGRQDAYLDERDAIFRDLSRTGRGAYIELRSLARRILFDVGDQSARSLQLGGGMSVVATPVAENPSDLLFDSMETARLMAWIAPQFHSLSAHAELLTVAGLMCDAGLFHLQANRRNLRGMGAAPRPQNESSHPHLSCALALGLSDLPAALPELIRTHHERLDGTGFPDRLRAWEYSPLARVVQMGVRFVELHRAALVSPEGTAAAVLRDEAQRGHWDLVWTEALLHLFGFPQDACPDPMTPSEAGLSLQPARPQLRRDDAHEGVPKPHAIPQPERAIPRPHFLRDHAESRTTTRKDSHVEKGIPIKKR